MWRSERRAFAALRPCAAALLAAALLAACSDFEPKDLVAWREGLFPEVAGAIPGKDQPYPNLATVPATPAEASSKGARAELQKKLEADNKAKAYKPDKSKAPAIPTPPPALPSGFMEAEQPFDLAAASAAESDDAGTLFGQRRVAIVLFAEGSATVDPRQVAKLRPLVEAVRGGGALELVGHASQTGDGLDQTKTDNFDLSVDRANAVAAALGRLGIGKDALTVSARGDSAPVLSAGGASGEAANRRVDIFLSE